MRFPKCVIFLTGTLLLTLQLQSCSALVGAIPSILGSASKSGISLDAQVGDKHIDTNLGGVTGSGKIDAKDNATVTVNTSKSSSRVDRADTVVVNELDYTLLLALIAVITLFVPSPLVAIKGGLSCLKRRFVQR